MNNLLNFHITNAEWHGNDLSYFNKSFYTRCLSGAHMLRSEILRGMLID